MATDFLRAVINRPVPPSVRSLVADEERMRQGHWLVSVLWVSFSAFQCFDTFDRKGIQIILKNLSQRPFQNSLSKKTKGNKLTHVHVEIGH